MRRLIAATLLALPLAAQAWGPDGHRTVAAIAAGLLKGTPTEARVKALLGDITMPLASIWADCAKGISPRQRYTYPAPGKYPDCGPLETPERIAEMADYVRRNDRDCTLGPEEDACHRQAHYADVAVQRSRYVQGFAGTRVDDVVGALRSAIQALQGRPAAGPPRFSSAREALFIVIHLVGDIHQPLHVGAVYLDGLGRRVDPDKTGYQPNTFTVGGNSLWLAGTPSPVKLHTLWDAVPDSCKPYRVDAAWLAQARQVHADAGDPADWPAQWASQSLGQAALAFQGATFSAKQEGRWSVKLPGDYEARSNGIKRTQLTLAGAKLAQLLKATLP